MLTHIPVDITGNVHGMWLQMRVHKITFVCKDSSSGSSLTERYSFPIIITSFCNHFDTFSAKGQTVFVFAVVFPDLNKVTFLLLASHSTVPYL